MSKYRAYFLLFVALSAAHSAPPKFEPLPSPSMQPSKPAPIVVPGPKEREIMLATAKATRRIGHE